jgi:lysophospholipase L1-like esterase
MDTPARNTSTHFQVPKSAVYVMVISFALIMILEVVARTVEYIWPAAPTGATLNYVPAGMLSDADQLRAEHRYWDRYMRHDPYLVFSPIPGWRGRYTHYNSFGFRGEEIAGKKPPDAIRIAILGGSTAFGAFVKDEDTFAAVLQGLLQENAASTSASGSRRKIEVINAAVPGYTSTQELISLHLKVLQLTPDVVIIFDSLNDVFNLGHPPQNAWEMDEWESQFTMTMPQRMKQLLFRSSALLRSASKLRGHLSEWIHKVGHQEGAPTWKPSPGASEAAANAYLENIRSMLALLKVRGIRGVTISQPARLWSMSEAEMAAYGTPLEKVRAMRSLRETMKRRTVDIVAQFGTDFSVLDLDDLGQVPAFFIDGDTMHFTEAGNRAVAHRIADALLKGPSIIEREPTLRNRHDLLKHRLIERSEKG